MGKTLVIAEKPSVAKTLAAYLRAPRKGAFYESDNWIVASCRGHIVDLALPDAYAGAGWGKPWTVDVLPMLPNPFELRVPEGSEDVVEQLSELLARPDVVTVVHACDPDREGEAILRRVLSYTGSGKPVKRLWATSLDDAALKKAFANMADDSGYDGLGDAAWGRACADWLVGMNMTRALSLAYRRPVYAGRVFSPTLHLVAQRTRDAAAFKSKPFWELEATLESGLKLSSERYGERSDAEAELDRLDGLPAIVREVSSTRQSKRPPKLYDLTGIQKDAATRYSATAADTLSALQSLYEAKLTSYPRTDTCYITSDDREAFEALLKAPATASIAGGEAMTAFESMGRNVGAVVSDKDVMGHTALLPTSELTKERFDALRPLERDIVRLIVARMLAAVSDPQRTTTTKVSATIGDVPFKASVTVEDAAGFRAIERAMLAKDPEEEQVSVAQLLEGLAEGSKAPVSALDLVEKKTKPPKLFTEATLLSAMEHADKLVDDKELANALKSSDTHPAGLGTPATRAETIERLIKRGYVARKKKALYATDEGLAIDALYPEELTSAELTAKWEQELSDVERGDVGVDSFISGMEGFVRQLVGSALADIDQSRVASLGPAETFGACPRCGQQIVSNRTRSVYWCSSRRTHKDDASGERVVDDEGCGWRLFGTVFGKKLTERQVASLIAGKVVQVAGLKKRDGSTFKAGLVISKTSSSGVDLAPRRR